MPEVEVSDNPKKNGKTRLGGRDLDRLEQDLLRAKNSQKVVYFDLAVATRHTDEEGTVSGTICQVDKYSIEIEVAGKNRRYWISKAMIVGYEIG